MNEAWICPDCGRVTVQNFPAKDYAKCWCQGKPARRQKIRIPTQARLEERWGRRRHLLRTLTGYVEANR